MATRMQQRRGTAADWTSANPVLAAGEIGFETDTDQFKIGDGDSQWDDLSYYQSSATLGGTLDDYIPLTQRAANNGVATLDAQGKIPVAQLGNIIDGAPEALNTLNELAAALGDNEGFITGFTNLQGTVTDLSTEFTTLEGTVDGIQTAVGGLTTTTGNLQTSVTTLQTDLGTTSTAAVNLATDLAALDLVVDGLVTDLDGVTSNVQDQIDAKLDSSVASTTYAPLDAPTFTGTVVLPSTTSIGTVDSTELGHLNGVTSSVQTQIDTKAPTANPTFTGTVAGVTKAHVGLGDVDNTSDTAKPVSTAQASAIATAKSEAIQEATDQVNAVIASAPAALNTLDELAAALGDDANFATTVTSSIATKAPIDAPTFTGLVTVAASGVAFTDGTQTKQGVPSITTIAQKTASYTLANLNERDTLVEIDSTSATTLTVPADSTLDYPIGTTLDILQTNTGQVTVAGAGGVTVNATPGLKLRTRWSSATLLKRAANSWVVFGDLTA